MTSEKELQLLIDHKVFFYGVPLWELAQELLSLRKAHEGWQLVPVEPTESMIVDGFESEPDAGFSEPDEWKAYQMMSGCQQAAYKARLCWAAMLAAAPKPD